MADQPFGSFVPTTQAWELDSAELTSENMRGLIVRLYQQINLIAVVLNTKDTGLYPLQEFINGQQFFPNPAYSSTSSTTPTQRQVFRFIVNFGSLPNTSTKSVAHGLTITTNFTFTRIYACASDTTNRSYLPIPFASPTLADNISLSVDATNVTIVTGSNRSAYTTTYVVLEYLKG
ncbi:MAG: hypothetical protein IPJ03_17120 [Ignavibacteriales bacterium]|nr:hypothetical protein [Ignavibacteriales bacterium]